MDVIQVAEDVNHEKDISDFFANKMSTKSPKKFWKGYNMENKTTRYGVFVCDETQYMHAGIELE